MGVSARDLVAVRGAFTLEVPVFEADDRGTVLLGPNGAGKTTLLLALQGLIPASGVVQRPPRTAAVFARPAVLRGSAMWNVAIVCEALGVPPATARERAARALSEVGLSEVSEHDARTLSTGQRQRLALARALAVEPRALLLDEPFANVDADARPALRALVRSYADRTNCDVILATSSLADATVCRNAIVLGSGRVVHSGTVASLEASDDPYVRALVLESAPKLRTGGV